MVLSLLASIDGVHVFHECFSLGGILWLSLLFRLDEEGEVSEHGHILLREAYFSPFRIESEGGVDPLLRGSISFPAQEVQ